MNLSDRTYSVRGKTRQLREITDWTAIRGHDEIKSAESATVEELGDAGLLTQIRSLEQAGWTIVPRRQGAEGARVYLHNNGSLALGTNRLSVRLADDLSEQQAVDWLQQQGLEVVDQLKFAKNLFVVAGDLVSDPLETARTLAAMSQVVYAEPLLIESLGGR